MLDINVQIGHWRASGQEDWTVACDLIERGRLRHGLFFAHLALEKILKAHVCRNTGNLAPRIHNLVRLAELAGLAPSPDCLDILADMNSFNLEGRYPDCTMPLPSQEEAHLALARAKEAMEWLTTLF